MQFEDDLELRIQRAVADAQKGQLPEAEAKLRDVIQLNPSYAPAHHNLGVALAEQGKTAEAIDCYDSRACRPSRKPALLVSRNGPAAAV